MAEDWRLLRGNAEKFHLDMSGFDTLGPFFMRLDGAFFRECVRRITGDFPLGEAEKRLPPEDLPRFLLLCVVAGYGAMEELYREKRWPECMLREIAEDLPRWLKILERDGVGYGLTPRIFGWCRLWLNGRVKSFGRLQGEDRCRFSSDIALFRLPGGEVRTARLPLPGSSPRPDLAPGDSVMNLHIPASGALTREMCLASLRRMRDFAAEFHPEEEYRAVVCTSWLLDPRFRELLKPGSNILQFQQLGHLIPLPEKDETEEVRWRIWGEAGRSMPAEELPVTNSMERGVAGFLAAGGKFRSGLLVIFRDELPGLLG